MRVSSAVGKSERIKTHQCSFYSSNLKEHSGSQNEAIGTKFRHLVVNTSQTPYERTITKQPHSHITGQNRLQTPAAPTRSALGPTSMSSPS
ncbi:hypothetical protein M9H77_04275 [Catharanthus roseus]|uniref:Uncharacterized protein n=1 Tax=Catharanthus roseus TaxID=4058 RepID=A0ACC0CDM8_CATRO|nr:hypothetical protein M9H77_04275 [Catharanthus roseus]